ncbi:hypothetical protein G6F65_017534 [Rhizopus arrhizus]|nr:hypothetical protein G6F65_017534 [Rhizopus arrhizus]
MSFLWFNAYPSQEFMGDVGALALGGALGTIAVIVRQEIVLFIMGGVFVVETLSVMIQVTWFKYTKRRYGTGGRAFLDHQHDAGADWPLYAEVAMNTMETSRADAPLVLILGLGETGVAAARWCARLGARLRVAAVQAVADRRDLEHQLAQLNAEVERLDDALKAVTTLIEQGSALKAEAVRIEIADGDIDALRKSERELANLQLRQQAIATRLSYQLEDGRQATLDGKLRPGTRCWNARTGRHAQDARHPRAQGRGRAAGPTR